MSQNNNTIQLNESGIQLPKGTKAVKIIHHADMDGVFSAIVTLNQLVKQGILPSRIRTERIQYGDEGRDKEGLYNKFKRSKGQAVVLVDFARIPDDIPKPDFWSDHHEFEGKRPFVPGKVGATQYKSDTSHIALIRTNNLVDGETLKAVDIIDSAGFANIMDVINIPKRFKEKGRMERLAIISNSLLTSLGLLDNEPLLRKFIKTTKPSLVSFYSNLLKYSRYNEIQKEALKELGKKNPDWDRVEKARNLMPSREARNSIVRDSKIPMRDKIQEGALEDYEEQERLKKKGNKRTKEEEERYRELVNKPIETARDFKKPEEGLGRDRTKFKSRGAMLVQTDGKLQRYIWTQINNKGLKHPFVFKRYPTFIQISVNPELPSDIKEKIDLNKVRERVLEEIRAKYENRYNRWAFNIIEKESGGHKGITNIAALGTLGIMPKVSRERLKKIESYKKRIGDLKTYGRGKLSDEDREKLKVAQKKLKDESLSPAEKEKYERIVKILMPTLERIMPKKAVELGYLLDKKSFYAETRKSIMDDIEKGTEDILKKMFNASRKIPVMGRNSDVKIPGGKEEFALESFMEELKS